MSKYLWERKEWYEFKYKAELLIAPLAKLRMLQGILLGKIYVLGAITQPAVMNIPKKPENNRYEDTRTNRFTLINNIGLGGNEVISSEKYYRVIVNAIHKSDIPLTIEQLKEWNKQLSIHDYSDIFNIENIIGRSGKHYSNDKDICKNKDLLTFVTWWNTSLNKMDGVIRAASALLWFQTIQPFERNNKWIATILSDIALTQDEGSKMRLYTISYQLAKAQSEYNEIVDAVQKGRQSIEKWYVWFIGKVTEAIKEADIEIEKIMTKKHFWDKHWNTDLNLRQKQVINDLLEDNSKNPILNTTRYLEITKTSRPTAVREIGGLLKKGIIFHIGSKKGKYVKYGLCESGRKEY